MTELKKTPLSTGKSKLEIIRGVPMPPASPLTQSAVSKEPPTEPVAPATPKQERPAPAAPAAKRPDLPAPKREAKSRAVYVAHQFTFAFSEESHDLAASLATKIGCKLEDIITLISKRFDASALDLNISTVKPRVGGQKRIVLKVEQSAIAELRRLHDPLNVRSDGYLLRAPVVAALDKVANEVLNELKEQYGV